MSLLNKLSKLRDPEIRAKNLKALHLALRERYWRLARPPMPDPVFLVGCSRAGTTVSYETLAASPALRSIGYEIPQFWDSLWGPHHNGWASEAATAADAEHSHRDRALAHFHARLGAGRVLDKTCINVLRIPYLNALFPRARFVFIHRDGRDNVNSLIEGWRHDAHFGLTQFLGAPPCPVAIENGAFTEWSFFLPPGWREYNQAGLAEVCAFQWVSANRLALEAKALIEPARWIQLRYEDIFERPVEMFAEVFERLELPFDAAIKARCASLGRRPTSIVSGLPGRSKWREQNPEAIERILPRIAPMQARLGYAEAG